jgi:uncharacterized protein (TIGR02246 family)
VKKFFLYSVLLFWSGNLEAQTNDEEAIRSLLAKQEDCWNKGDLFGFMKGYWENDSLLFIGKNGITYGYRQTLLNYQKNYPTKEQMGQLRFELIKVEMISEDAAQVAGKWMLTRPQEGDLSGYFSLLLRKLQGIWVIVADHSS